MRDRGTESSEGSNRRPVSSCTIQGQAVADLAGQAGSLQLRLAQAEGKLQPNGVRVWPVTLSPTHHTRELGY